MIPTLAVLLAGQAFAQTTLYEEFFPHAGGGNITVDTAGWAQDATGASGGGTRIYDATGGDGAVWTWATTGSPIAFYTDTALDNGATGMAFTAIDQTAFSSISFNISLVAETSLDARFAVNVAGSWYSSNTALGTFTDTSLAFDNAAANWNSLGVVGSGINEANATIGAVAGADLTGNIEGIGWVVLSPSSQGMDINSISITAIPEPGTYALLTGTLALAFVSLRRRKA